MFGKQFARRTSACLALAVLGCGGFALQARADKTKLDNADPLDLDSAWSGGEPGANDWAVFDDSLKMNHAFAPGGDLNWRGIRVATSVAPISFSSGNTVSLGDGGIDVWAATPGLTIDSNVAVATSHVWNVASTLTVNGDASLGNHQLTIQGGGITTITGAISGAGGTCVVNTTGSLTLSGTNSFSGGLSLLAGTVIANTSQALGNFIGTTSLNGGTLVAGGNNLLIGNAIHVTGAATIVGNAVTSFYGNFSGNGTLNWSITGSNARLDLGAVHDSGISSVPDFSAFTGTLDFGSSTGQIRLQGSASNSIADLNFSNATVNLGTGSAFMLPRNDSTQSLGALAGGPNTAIYGSSTGTSTTTWAIGGANSSTTFGGMIANGKAATASKTNLTKTGTGSLTLTNSASSYSGSLTIQSGALVVSTVAGLGRATTAIALGTSTANGTLAYTGTGATLTRLFNISSAGTLDSSGTGALTLNGIGAIGWGSLNQARTFTLSGSNTGLNTFGERIIDAAANPVSVVKRGPGTWMLITPDNNYSGGTTITGGTLLATAVGTPTGTGDIDVGNGSTFGGTTTVPGRVTVEAGGHLAPGTPGTNNGVGTLTLTNADNALTMNAGSFLDLDLQASPFPHDMIVIPTGVLTLANSVNVNVFQAGTNQLFTTDGSYDIFSIAGSSNLMGSASFLQVANTAQSGKAYNFVLINNTSGPSTLTLQITDVVTGHFWDGPTGADHSWSTPANWIGAVPGSAGDTATFGTASSTAGSVLLDGGRHIGTLVFDNATSYSLDPGSGGKLFLDNGTANASVTVLTGSHAITAPVELTSSTTISFSNSTNALTIFGMITNNTGNTAASLTIIGPGNLTLAGNDNYAGVTSVGANAQLQFSGGVTHLIGSVTGAGGVQINAGSAVVSNDLTVSALTINGAHTLRSNSAVSKVNALSLGHTGSGTAAVYTGLLQLNNNRMILQTADSTSKAAAITAINEAIFAGKASVGTKGITSSTVAADPQHLTLAVYDNAHLQAIGGGGPRVNWAGGTNNVDANSLLVTPALKGDVNLDGVVDINDLVLIGSHWQQTGLSAGGISTMDMTQGDVNEDGIVDINDLVLAGSNWQATSSFNLALTMIADGIASGEASLPPATLAAVPEPGGLGLIAIGAALFWPVRKRRVGPLLLRNEVGINQIDNVIGD